MARTRVYERGQHTYIGKREWPKRRNMYARSYMERRWARGMTKWKRTALKRAQWKLFTVWREERRQNIWNVEIKPVKNWQNTLANGRGIRPHGSSNIHSPLWACKFFAVSTRNVYKYGRYLAHRSKDIQWKNWTPYSGTYNWCLDNAMSLTSIILPSLLSSVMNKTHKLTFPTQIHKDFHCQNLIPYKHQ